MSMKNSKTKVVILIVLLTANVISCTWTASDTSTISYNSIFDVNKSLVVLAETFPEYQWNESAKNAYALYLKSLNDYYFRKQYAASILLFYDAIDFYPNDARFYVRLAESQARNGDTVTALRTLNSAENYLPGFLNQPGIVSYVRDLNQAPVGVVEQQQPKGLIGKSIGAVTWLPRKILGFIPNPF